MNNSSLLRKTYRIRTSLAQSRFLLAYVMLFGLFMISPLVVIVGAAFEPQELLRFPPHGLSIRWFEKALNNTVYLESARNSLIIAVQATFIALILGIPAAYGMARLDFRGKTTMVGVMLAPLLVPELIIGLALLQMIAFMGFSSSIVTLTLGHALVCLPYVVRTVQAGIVGTNPSVEEAAASLGASRLQVYWHVVIPLARPSIVAAALFSFLISFDNAVISLFLASARTTTLPITMYNYVQYNIDPGIAAIATLLMVVSVFVMVLTRRIVPLGN